MRKPAWASSIPGIRARDRWRGAFNTTTKWFWDRFYFDLLHLAQTRSFDSALLIRALRATAERRRVSLPPFEPIGLTFEFGRDAAKRAQWAAFLRRTRVVREWTDLERVVEALHAFLGPVVSAARDGTSFDVRWAPGGPWS